MYRGTQAATGRTVAVKVLNLELDDPLRRAQFDNDSQAMQALAKHPHVATVYDAGITAEGHPYVVMEYLPRNLAHLIAEEGRLRWQEAVALGTEVASALVAGRRRGVLHRDVTPANILLAADDVPRLADFGLAGLAASPDAPTGSITARLTHAAPEVIQGKTPDQRSDVYSLASTLHEALSGAPPFVRPGDETLVPVVSRILGENPPSLQRFGVPRDVEDVIHGAMAKDPAERPATAEVFAQITQRAQASGAWDDGTAVVDEVAPRDAAPTLRAGHPSPAIAARRRRALGLAAAGVLVAGGIVWAVTRAGSGDSSSKPTTTPSFVVVSEAPDTTDASSTTKGSGTLTSATSSPAATEPATTLPEPTTTAAIQIANGAGFHMTAFSTGTNSLTFEIAADGKAHAFTYDIAATGGAASTWCPSRSDITATGGPGLAGVDLGSCFPSKTPNHLTFTAFRAATSTFTLWVCDGPTVGSVCGSPRKKSTNTVDVTVIATR